MLLIAAEVPSLPLAPSPTPPLNVLPAPLPHAPSEAASRYFWKLSVVPDSSLRKTTVIFVAGQGLAAVQRGDGRVVPFVMPPLKIFAAVGPSRTSPSTPVQVVGDRDRAEHHRQVPRRRTAARWPPCPTSPVVALSGESEPPKSVWLADELTHPGARAVGGVVQRLARAGALVSGDEPRHGVGLGGRPAGLQGRFPATLDRGLAAGSAAALPTRRTGALLSLPQPASSSAPGRKQADRDTGSIELHLAPSGDDGVAHGRSPRTSEGTADKSAAQRRCSA